LSTYYIIEQRYILDDKAIAWFFRAMIVFALMSLLSERILAQDDSNDVLIDPVVAHSETLKFSTALFENALPYPGKAFGLGNGNEVELLGFEPKQRFQLETENYDSILFYFTWLLSDNSQYDVNYFVKVSDNLKFNSEIVFDPGLVNQGTLVNVGKINSFKGKKLYDVVIDDDVSPLRIRVSPLPESTPYVDVVQSADTNRFQVRLKRSNEIDALIKQNMEKFKSQGYAEIPIGVILSDPILPEHNKILKFTLKQKIRKSKVGS
jgi:hypothetical protein